MPDRIPIVERLIDFGIGGAFIEGLRYLFGRKKDSAETDQLVSKSWQEYAQTIGKRFEELELKYRELSLKYYELEGKYYKLLLQQNEKDNHNSRA